MKYQSLVIGHKSSALMDDVFQQPLTSDSRPLSTSGGCREA